jgi:hypothetical protein
LAGQLEHLAQSETPLAALTAAPLHADSYTRLLEGRIDAGPVFTFPTDLAAGGEVVVITNVSELSHHFGGWTAGEIPERSPIVGVVVDGQVVSVCFCARRTEIAAEAGLETAIAYRGRGFGARVVAQWGRLIRQSGRLPLYSTSWNNSASLAVARKLGLTAAAADWNLYEVAG